jgi:hypothetical protein
MAQIYQNTRLQEEAETSCLLYQLQAGNNNVCVQARLLPVYHDILLLHHAV